VPNDCASPPLTAPPPLDFRAHALFLDLDGTLVDIAARPEDVVAGEALRALLRDLSQALGGAVALLTGRTIESAETVLGGAIDSIAGLHGFEQRFDGEVTRARADLTAIGDALEHARRLASAGALPARIEDKHAGFALHYRDAPDAGAIVRRMAEQIAETHGLAVIEGKMVVELSLGVRTKGDALAAFMQEAPFSGRTPIAVGDDVTDEDAFVAARDRQGFGVLVGQSRISAADYVLRSANDVATWLAAGLRP
jgi:trehalose 6-phosphate phosphatase